MEKLVITFSYADYECSYTTVECIEYESAEAFYVHLEERVNQYLKARAEYQVAYEKWNEECRALLKLREKKTKNRLTEDEYLAKSREVLETRPHFDYESKWKIGNIELPICDYVTRSDFGEKEHVPKFDPPEIQTLEEWFNYKLE